MLVRRWWSDYCHKADLTPAAIERIIQAASAPVSDNALRRLACVSAVVHFRRDMPSSLAAGMPELVRILGLEFPNLRVSRSSIYAWIKRYQESGIYGLIDHRGGDQKSSRN